MLIHAETFNEKHCLNPLVNLLFQGIEVQQSAQITFLHLSYTSQVMLLNLKTFEMVSWWVSLHVPGRCLPTGKHSCYFPSWAFISSVSIGWVPGSFKIRPRRKLRPSENKTPKSCIRPNKYFWRSYNYLLGCRSICRFVKNTITYLFNHLIQAYHLEHTAHMNVINPTPFGVNVVLRMLTCKSRLRL